jgi:hypothetical protein
MSWEYRGGGRRYLYEARRVNGRVVKRCIGREGAIWTDIAWIKIARFRYARNLAQGDERERRELARKIARAVTLQYQAVGFLVSVAMAAAGHHQHKRGGPWRKRRRCREGPEETEGNGMGGMMGQNMLDRLRASLSEKSRALIEQARKPNLSDKDLEALADKMDGDAQAYVQVAAQQTAPDPAALGLARALIRTAPLGNIARPNLPLLGREAIIESMMPEAPLVQEVFRRQAAAKYEEIAGPNPSSLEALLCERVITTWLLVTWAEILMGQNNTSRYWVQRYEASMRQHLAAVRSLAQVRRLQMPLPPINIALPGATQTNVGGPGRQQVNLGHQQVNITGSGHEPHPDQPLRPVLALPAPGCTKAQR